jgi:hypothetical protein
MEAQAAGSLLMRDPPSLVAAPHTGSGGSTRRQGVPRAGAMALSHACDSKQLFEIQR